MNRIYHRYELWECWKNGFFWNESGLTKSELKDKCIEFFSNKKLVEKYMRLVVKLWPFSCENNLTNDSMNRVAWLGQAAACLYCKCPSPITMESWREVPAKSRDEANEIAEKIISDYEKTPIQLWIKL